LRFFDEKGEGGREGEGWEGKGREGKGRGEGRVVVMGDFFWLGRWEGEGRRGGEGEKGKGKREKGKGKMGGVAVVV